MTFLRNAWYVAALASEVDATALFHRKLLGSSVLIYRKGDGTAIAMRDRCPHRFAPLHLGVRDGDNVVCGYHGLKFDCAGNCIESPHRDGSIPKMAPVETYPLVEKDGFLWIFPGEAELADPELIPDYSLVFDGPASSVGETCMHIPANYELVVDNIMDLSHADFVHGPLLNTQGQLAAATPVITGDERTAKIRWEWKQSPAQEFFSPFLPDPGGDAEQWVEVGWTAPSAMYLYVGAVQGSRDYDKGLVFWANHIMTPETETTTHYFYRGRRNWLIEDTELNAAFLAATIQAFTTEDTPMVSAVQEEMGSTDLFALRPVIFPCDAGAVRARRKLAALIRSEQSGEPVKEETP